MKQDERFGHAAGMLGERVRQVLERIPPGIGGKVREIRLRGGHPLGLTALGHPQVVGACAAGRYIAISGRWRPDTSR